MEARVLVLVEAVLELVEVLLLLLLLLVLPGAGEGVGEGDARKPDMFYKKKWTTGGRLRGGKLMMRKANFESGERNTISAEWKQ